MNNAKEIASNYILSLVTACTDKTSLEYYDAKAALEDLDGLISAVQSMTSEEVSIESIVHYCTMYQQEALEQI